MSAIEKVWPFKGVFNFFGLFVDFIVAPMVLYIDIKTKAKQYNLLYNIIAVPLANNRIPDEG